MQKKNIWFEIGIHLFILLTFLPATIFACMITIKSMLFTYPNYMYDSHAATFYGRD